MSYTTVSATLFTTSGVPAAPSSFVRFILRGYAPNVPRILLSNVIVDEIEVDAFPNLSGVISINIVDVVSINPGTCYYHVQFWQNGVIASEGDWLITGGTFDLDTAAPITTFPVVTPPTGDNTYIRLDLGNENLLPGNLYFAFALFTSQGGIPSLPKLETLTYTVPTGHNIARIRLVILANETSPGTWVIKDGSNFTYLTLNYPAGGLAQTVDIDTSLQGSFCVALNTAVITIQGSGFTTYHKGFLEIQWY